MQTLLGDEFAAFAASYSHPPSAGLRVNTLKIDPARFAARAPFPIEPLGPHIPAGFRLPADHDAGKHPDHTAGLYYLQEPSAMSVAALVDPQPGDLVLDLAAAPGGKATHLAALMAGQGHLIANDIHKERARTLLGNLVRMGARHVTVTSVSPRVLADQLGPVFDRVLVDAPCSGEGMFRKNPAVEWSPAIVTACARRQNKIVDDAVRLVRPGGILVYATCTFSPEEDEGVLMRLLKKFPDDWEVLAPPPHWPAAPGRPDWLPNAPDDLVNTLRFWPHQGHGEGHFVARLRRRGADESPKRTPIDSFPTAGPADLAAFDTFAADHLKVDFDRERIFRFGERLFLAPITPIAVDRLYLLRHGLLLGDLRPEGFRPSQVLALTLTAQAVTQSVAWAADDPRLQAYLCGRDLDDPGPDGWVLAAVDGFGLGWAKRVAGRLKNHYPREQRRPC